jgi:hypothetical protein
MKIRQPALFIAGSEDPVIKFSAKALEQLPTTVPCLKKALVIPGGGHWIQQCYCSRQDRPAEARWCEQSGAASKAVRRGRTGGLC